MSRAMKNSGIPWIGDIPSHWRIELIGSCIKEVNNPNTGNAEDNALQFKMGTIISKKGGDSKYNPESLEAYNKVRQGDIILNGLNLSFDFISQRVGLVRENGVITSTYLALRPLPLIDSRFLNYLFKGYDYCKALHSMGRGLRATLVYNEFRKYSVIFPPISEQQSIADFLDKKCDEIDELISLQEKIIEELKAYKQSVITEAVCKGLNPDVPMKDSGIEWVDSVPRHWNRAKIQYLAALGSGTNLTTEQITDSGDYPVYGGNGLRGYYSDYNREGEFVLIGRQGALCGNINYANSKFWATEHAVVCHPKMTYITHWFGELLRAMNLNQYSLASAQPGLAVERIKQLSIPVPPIAEQRAIADYLEQKGKEIDALISVKQSKVEALKEYKKSIIYEYITGKKDING